MEWQCLIFQVLKEPEDWILQHDGSLPVKWSVSFTKFQALLVDEQAPSELEKVGFNLSEILFYCKNTHSAWNNFSAGRQAGSPVTLNWINCLFEELNSQNSPKFGISLTVPSESSTDILKILKLLDKNITIFIGLISTVHQLKYSLNTDS